MSKTIKKILIANRGEIACRIIRTCQAMNIQTVAVYSSADENALHVQMADEVYDIGAAPAPQSYLDQNKILDVCKKANVDAVHPGYGFLSENAEFSKKLKENDIVFIGPSTHSITMMGDKAGSKALMEKAGVPLVPGYHGTDQSPEILLSESKKIGFPVLLKASAGGGGKGMRIVHDETEFDEALNSAKREALNGFGDETMLVEKYLANPRHIEVQVFGDSHGNIVHLFERDCSLQRRHQKVIEEAPALGLTEEQRNALGNAAINAAKATDYLGAGTVEFLFDEDGSFYFMEMNTRLQVEHPVTEMITGLDLVQWQIKVAMGEELPLKQNQIERNGHAVEVRLYAEDPKQDFLPQAGSVKHLVPPDNARFDSALKPVLSWKKQYPEHVTIFYDPMIAKIIVHEQTREQAIDSAIMALRQTECIDLKTNRDFLIRCLEHDDFKKGNISTKFIEQHEQDLLTKQALPATNQAPILACLALLALQHEQTALTSLRKGDPFSPWNDISSWSSIHTNKQHFTLNDQALIVQINSDEIIIETNGKTHHCAFKAQADGFIHALIDEQAYLFRPIIDEQKIDLFLNGDHYSVSYQNPLASTKTDKRDKDGGLNAPMPSKIVKINVELGQSVQAGETLMILEAMKMEHKIIAPTDGTIANIHTKEGDQVDDGFELIEISQ